MSIANEGHPGKPEWLVWVRGATKYDVRNFSRDLGISDLLDEPGWVITPTGDHVLVIERRHLELGIERPGYRVIRCDVESDA